MIDWIAGLVALVSAGANFVYVTGGGLKVAPWAIAISHTFFLGISGRPFVLIYAGVAVLFPIMGGIIFVIVRTSLRKIFYKVARLNFTSEVVTVFSGWKKQKFIRPAQIEFLTTEHPDLHQEQLKAQDAQAVARDQKQAAAVQKRLMRFTAAREVAMRYRETLHPIAQFTTEREALRFVSVCVTVLKHTEGSRGGKGTAPKLRLE